MGVKQGNVTSTLLFITYMDIVMRNYKEHMVRMSEGYDGLNVGDIVTWNNDSDDIRMTLDSREGRSWKQSYKCM